METDFIPIDYNYFDFEGRNYAKIFGRNSKGKRICIIDSCSIYLWAILKDDLKQDKIEKLVGKINKIKLDLKGRQTKVEKVEIHNKNFLGKKVKALKIFATNYKDLHDIADKLDFPEITNRRGYDLGFVTHYIIERKINPLCWYEIEGDLLNNSLELGGIDMALDVDYCIKLKSSKQIKEKPFTPKALAYDIETNDLQIGKGEILMISLVSNNFKKVITWKKAEGKKQNWVEYVKDESELLEKFVEYVKEVSPDFLVGYYSDGFDLPYIKARADKNNVKLPLGLDGSQPKFSRGIDIRGKITGIVHVDILKFIRTAYAQYMQSETLSLNEVSKEFLGDTKKDFDAHIITKDIKWEKFYEYNLHDSVLTLKLFEKFWPDLLEFTKVIQEPIFDISRNGLSKQVESYILHNLEKFNEIPEKKPVHKEIRDRKHSKSVEGAFVYEPKPGLYNDLAIFDFTSMHTSIIISMNISKGTLLEKKENAPELRNLGTRPSLGYAGRHKKFHESPELEFQGKKTKFYFSKEPGFFPSLLKEIFEKRKQYKSEYKKNPNVITKARSNAFKLLSASAHGYIGFFGARYYSLESSASILAFVRKFNKETIEKTKQAGFNVIYADTDSVAFTTKGKTKSQVLEFLKKLNSELPGVMELELEGFFKRGLWVTKRSGKFGAKKKYALIDKDGKIKIRGFETVRRDWCKLARHMQNKMIRQIL
ncbi:MAG: DNA-directed DNA polymerase, partial [Nanoarchaeota archaeon]